MAKVICENCGRTIRGSDLRCLYCNAINVHRKKDVDNTSSFLSDTNPLFESSFSPEYFNKTDQEIVTPSSNTSTEPKMGNTVASRDTTVYHEQRSFGENNNPQGLAQVMVQRTDSTSSYLSVKKESSAQPTRFIQNKLIATIIGVIAIMFILATGLIVYEELDYIIWDAQNLDEGYYINNKQLYFFDSSVYDEEKDIELSRWWQYDITTHDWTIYQESASDTMAPIFSFTDDDVMWEYEVEQVFGLDEDLINIRLSKTYIDAGHHYRPRGGYYLYDNLAYYYLNDYYAWDEEISGWYRYNPDQGAWLFYCTYENKDFLGDVLYYYPTTVFVGESDASWRTTGVEPPPSFHETEWYKLYQAHEAELREKYD